MLVTSVYFRVGLGAMPGSGITANYRKDRERTARIEAEIAVLKSNMQQIFLETAGFQYAYSDRQSASSICSAGVWLNCPHNERQNHE
jgi:hypothetical protein